MKLPNGYGGIVKLNGNRRRPFMARKTIDYKPNGTPVYHIIGYYTTKEEALMGLATYNCQEDAPRQSITLATIYIEWLKRHKNNVAKTTYNNYSSAYKNLSPIAGKPISTLKYIDFQSVIDGMINRGLSYSSCKKVRSLINMLVKYANINEYCDIHHNKHISMCKNVPVRPHKPFTRQQINKLWASKHPSAYIPLILLYTGMRSIELRSLTPKDIDRRQRLIRVRRSKTDAGIRIIPIHTRIQSLIADHIHDLNMSYSAMSKHFKDVMASINCKHTTHDCRHTFATLLDTAGANPNARRALLGHKNGDVTDRVYTHKALRELRRTVQLLK